MYTNTPCPLPERSVLPLLTGRFLDDTLDVATDPVHIGALLLRLPLTLFWGFFGSLFSRHTDVMAVFRKQ